MTATPDYPDWTQPVAQAEHDVSLYNQTLSGATEYDLGPFDTSQLNQLQLTLGPLRDANNQQWAAVISWGIGVNMGPVQTITSWGNTDSVTAGSPAGFTRNIPVQGSSCGITVFSNSAGAAAQFGVLGTTRAAVPYKGAGKASAGTLLLYTGTVPIGAAGRGTFVVPSVERAYAVLMGPSAATTSLQLLGLTRFAAAFRLAPLLIEAGSTNWQYWPEVPMPDTALQVLLINSGTATANMDAVVWDVS